MKKVLILDFGGQYNLLVARRVRECGVYCELRSYRTSMDEVRAVANAGCFANCNTPEELARAEERIFGSEAK